MTCKECLCYEVCQNKWAYSIFIHCQNKLYMEGMEEKCDHFKPKSRFVELPCEVGSTVYDSRGQHIRVKGGAVDLLYKAEIYFDSESPVPPFVRRETRLPITFKGSDVGKTVFLSREEAEKALQRKEDDGK